jgi:hypothetical protein
LLIFSSGSRSIKRNCRLLIAFIFGGTCTNLFFFETYQKSAAWKDFIGTCEVYATARGERIAIFGIDIGSVVFGRRRESTNIGRKKTKKAKCRRQYVYALIIALVNVIEMESRICSETC